MALGAVRFVDMTRDMEPKRPEAGDAVAQRRAAGVLATGREVENAVDGSVRDEDRGLERNLPPRRLGDTRTLGSRRKVEGPVVEPGLERRPVEPHSADVDRAIDRDLDVRVGERELPRELGPALEAEIVIARHEDDARVWLTVEPCHAGRDLALRAASG